MTMAQSENPFATAEKYAHELNDPLPYSPLRRRRAQSLSSGLPRSGLVAARVNSINKVNLLTGNVNSADSDRNTLPSQQKPSLPIATPLYRPVPRNSRVFRAEHKTPAEVVADLANPSTEEETPDAILATSHFDMASGKDVAENEGSNEEPLEVIGDSTANIAPLHRGPRRNKTSMSQIVTRDDPRKGATYDTESFRTTAGQYNHWSESAQRPPFSMKDRNLEGVIQDASLDERLVSRKSLPDPSSASSIMTSGSPKEPDTQASQLTTTADAMEQVERVISADSPSSSSSAVSAAGNTRDAATGSMIQGGSPPAPGPCLPLRCVEKFSHIEKLDNQTEPFSQYEYTLSLLEMDRDEVREFYPLEVFVETGAEHGCDVHDWACPRQAEKPLKKLLRFASRPDFAPSTHYESESEGLADSNASLLDLLDADEGRPEFRRSTLHVVNVHDRVKDDGLNTLVPLRYKPSADAKREVLLPRTYDPSAEDGFTTLSPRTYSAPARDGLKCLPPLTNVPNPGVDGENWSFVRRKPIPRKAKNSSLRCSASGSIPTEEVEDDGYSTDDSIYTYPRGGVSMATKAAKAHHDDGSDHYDGDMEPIRIEKRHTRNESTGFRSQVAASASQFMDAYSSADAVKEPAPISAIDRRPLPTITGVLDLHYKFPAPSPQQRGVSMPVFPPRSTGHGDQSKHSRRSSFGKLLTAFGKKGQDPELAERREQPKKSLGRRFSQSVGRRLSSMWSK
jgi:hypothetical protein